MPHQQAGYKAAILFLSPEEKPLQTGMGPYEGMGERVASPTAQTRPIVFEQSHRINHKARDSQWKNTTAS